MGISIEERKAVSNTEFSYFKNHFGEPNNKKKAVEKEGQEKGRKKRPFFDSKESQGYTQGEKP